MESSPPLGAWHAISEDATQSPTRTETKNRSYGADGPHLGSRNYHLFRPASVTLKVEDHEHVGLLVHSQDTAMQPATASVTDLHVSDFTTSRKCRQRANLSGSMPSSTLLSVLSVLPNIFHALLNIFYALPNIFHAPPIFALCPSRHQSRVKVS